ncbi:MAG TPA: CpsD/CapB family tyrosine-protein kinase [Candidatus Dormibacteraeota bacterium]|nr:CpsD/CapB family tyrosine-protein kinase [Candidatus Dormibacteraeota bacterium]
MEERTERKPTPLNALGKPTPINTVGKSTPMNKGGGTVHQAGNGFGNEGFRDWARGLYRTPPEKALEPLPLDPRFIEACVPIALKLGGPKLTRLGVTSALRGEGRTTIALAMAAVQSREFGRRALLVDADFENPTLGESFGYEGAPGLAELTSGEVSVDRAVHEIGEGVALLPAGAANKRRSRMVRELLSSDVLQELASLYEVAVVDMPPLLGSTDGPLLAANFENALLVVRAQVTPIARVEEAVGMLARPPVVLVNGVTTSLPGWLTRLLDHS